MTDREGRLEERNSLRLEQDCVAFTAEEPEAEAEAEAEEAVGGVKKSGLTRSLESVWLRFRR
jgi:hypothetical protein